MPSEVDIANRALAQAGTRSGIASLTETSKEAQACTLLFTSTRDLALQSAPWDFARAAVSLALLKARPGTPENQGLSTPFWDSTSQPTPPWFYEYAAPSDCLFMRWILCQWGNADMPGPPAKFSRSSDLGAGGGRIPVILTNAQNAIGVYTVRMTDPNTWTPYFQECVVLALAARLSIPLSGDKNLALGNMQAANAALVNARVTDGNEGFGTTVEILPDWIRARDSLPGPYEPPDPLVYVNLFQMP